jgi:hypothetical protein
MFFVELFRSKGLNPGVAPGFSGLPPLNDTSWGRTRMPMLTLCVEMRQHTTSLCQELLGIFTRFSM